MSYISKKSEWYAQIFFERKKRKSWLFSVVLFGIVCFLSKKQKVVQEYDIFLSKSRKWSKNMIFFYQKVESGLRIWYFSIKKLKALSASDSIFLVIGKSVVKVIGFGKLRIDNRKNLTIHQVLSDF